MLFRLSWGATEEIDQLRRSYPEITPMEAKWGGPERWFTPDYYELLEAAEAAFKANRRGQSTAKQEEHQGLDIESACPVDRRITEIESAIEEEEAQLLATDSVSPADQPIRFVETTVEDTRHDSDGNPARLSEGGRAGCQVC